MCSCACSASPAQKRSRIWARRRSSLKQVFLRTLIRLIPFEAFSFLGGSKGWHDEWSGTKVIRVRGSKQWDATS